MTIKTDPRNAGFFRTRALETGIKERHSSLSALKRQMKKIALCEFLWLASTGRSMGRQGNPEPFPGSAKNRRKAAIYAASL